MRLICPIRRLLAGLAISSSLLVITPAHAAPSNVKGTILADNGSLAVIEQGGQTKVIAPSVGGNWPYAQKTFNFDIDDSEQAMRACRIHVIAWGDGSVAQGVLAHFAGDGGVAYTGQTSGPLNNIRLSSVTQTGGVAAMQTYASVDANAAAIISGATSGSTQFTSLPAATGGIPGTWGPVALPEMQGRNEVKFLWTEPKGSLNANPNNYRVLTMPCTSVVKPKPEVASLASWEIAGQFNPTNNISTSTNPFEVWSYGYKQSKDCKGPLVLFRNKGRNPNAAGRPVSHWSLGTDGTANSADLPMVGQSEGATQTTALRYSPQGLTMHPGPQGQCAVVRFTAPIKGVYRMMGRFWVQNVNGSAGTMVVVNNTNGIDPRVVLSAPSGTSNNPFSWSGNLNSGDTVDFMVDSNGPFFSDSIGLHGYIQRDE